MPALPDPVIDLADVREVAPDVVVIGNHGVTLVPNVGLVAGEHSVLIVETGMGPHNGDTVLKFGMEYAKGRRIYLTTTHFHPEHAFGAQTFAGEATFLPTRSKPKTCG
jgi:glyoxylase-like metal-dependent hydrolase (beta-lactamase superfamily II)